MTTELSKRERTVLRYVVRDFIETATPVGSRYISRKHENELGLSSASIRNVLADLEDHGLVAHPHTSAGRIPTDLGYRMYLDSLMELDQLSRKDQKAIRDHIETTDEQERLLKEVTRVLGRISHQLSIITPPSFKSGIFERLELAQVQGRRLIVIISIDRGLAKTIMMEMDSEIPREKLDDLSRMLNERLSGLTLEDIRNTFADRVRTIQNDDTGLIRLFIESVDKLFALPHGPAIHIGGAQDIIDQPEFVNPQDFRSVIELINNEEMIIHVLEKHHLKPQEVKVSIGKENGEEQLQQYSVVATNYSVGSAQGSIGVIGPRRMPYYRVIPVLDYVARTVEELFAGKTQN